MFSIPGSNRPLRQSLRRRVVRGVLLTLAVLAAGCRDGQDNLSPEERVRTGWDLYRFGEFSLAIRSFEKAAADPAAKPEMKAKALYGLANTWALRRPDEDPAKAANYFKQVIQLDPKGELASWALLGLARLKHMVPVDKTFDTPKVLKAYQDVLDRYPGTPAAEEALIFQQSVLLCTDDPEDAQKVIDTLTRFINDHPKSHFVSFAWRMTARAWHILRDPPRELHCLVRSYETQEVDPRNPFFENSGTYWIIATLAEYEVGDFDTARKFYNKLCTEYPVDFRRFAARAAIKRMDDLEAKFRRELQGGRS